MNMMGGWCFPSKEDYIQEIQFLEGAEIDLQVPRGNDSNWYN